MSIYLIIYSVSIFLWIYYWFIYFKQYKNNAWLSFFIFTILSSIWFLWYFLFFSWINNYSLLLIFTKIDYYLSIWVLYSFLYFLYNFSSTQKKINLWKNSILLIIFYLANSYFYIWSDKIISWLIFDQDLKIYRENFWSYYYYHIFLTLIFIPIFTYIIIKKYNSLTNLNKIKLKNIIISVFLAVTFIMIFQLILPFFWIWLFEKEIIFVYILFVFSVIYSLKRYFFINFWYWIWKIIISIFSLLLSYFFIIIFSKIIPFENWYWSYYDKNWFFTIITWILLYITFNNLLSKYFLWNSLKDDLKKSIFLLEQKISQILDFENLNNYLKNEIKKIFKTNYCEIKFIENESSIKSFFEKNISEKFFINDIVFIEEKKTKFNKDDIIKCLSKDDFLLLPLFNNKNWKLIWTLHLWTKSFWDFYNLEEIDILKRFSFFLEIHLKYINTYNKIQNFSITLDKKVDEKTIEYNNLINKQKEFISTISHEIRSPLSSAIFQADSLIDDIEKPNIEINYIKKELNILNTILIKISDLTNKLFKIQYYETREVTLYKEKIKVAELIKNEIEIFSHINQNIVFLEEIDKNIWFIEIDKIQFTQVFENIVNNAIKFCEKNWKILISCYIDNWNLVIWIEDNWKWFEGINISELFDKYSTWKSNNSWLWMWLYLCKKIISMHKWDIFAEKSIKLWWAKFIIYIPCN